MKKTLALALALLLIVGLMLTACQTPVEPETGSPSDGAPSDGAPTEPDPVEPTCQHTYSHWELTDNGYETACDTCEEPYTFTKDVTEGLAFASMGRGTCTLTGRGTWDGVGELVIPPISPSGEIVTTIGTEAFYYNSTITKVVMPPTITLVAGSAFLNCVNLETVEFSTVLREIHGCAFQTTGLTSIILPDSLTGIGANGFYGCNKVTELRLSKNMTRIEAQCFDSIAVKDLVIPDNITSIGAFAFCRCTGMETVVIPDSVTRIENDAFSRSTTIKSIIIGSGVKSIGTAAFDQNPALETFIITSTLTKLPERMFEGDSSLVFNVPATVTEIGKNAVRGLKDLTVDAANPNYKAEGGVLYNKEGTIAYSCCQPDADGVIRVADGTLELKDDFFFKSFVTTVILPASLQKIGYRVFNLIPRMKNIYFKGTEEAWNLIDISTKDNANSTLNSKTVTFNYSE